MSANVEKMAFCGERPWHGLGTEVKGLMTAKEAIVAGGLDWEVKVQPLFNEGSLDIDTGAARMMLVEGFNGVVRQSDNKTLGVVGGRYTPVQNTDCFDFFDALVENNNAKYECVGALDGGRRVWLLARMEGDIVVKNPKLADDRIERYMMLSNTHDGTGNLRAFFTNVRVVCQNTERMALAGAGTDGITLRHTKGITAKIEEAKRIAELSVNYTRQFEERCNKLAATPFNIEQMNKVCETLFPAKADGKVATRSQNNRDALLNLFTSGKGNFGETAWDAFNAITEYADYQRGTRVSEGGNEVEARWTSNLFGSGAAFKDEGMEAIVVVAGIEF